MDAITFIEACLPPYQTKFSESVEPIAEDSMVSALLYILKKNYKFNIVKWEPSNCAYPEYMFLGTDRGILAYIKFNYVSSVSRFDLEMLKMSSRSVMQTIAKADSHLDRPVFFVHIINTADEKKLLFETNEQIKDRWLKTGFADSRYIPIIEEMGSAENLLSILAELKNNNVHFN